MLQRRGSAFASPQRSAGLDMSLRQDSASDQPGPLAVGSAASVPQARRSAVHCRAWHALADNLCQAFLHTW